MSKQRVLIVDKDIDYIIPLQRRFVEEYGDKIDLEIITDEKYLSLLFEEPQKINALVISEAFYSPLISKHNVGAVILLTERNLEEIKFNNVYPLKKYSSITEIYNEIIIKGRLAGSNEKNRSKKTQVILVGSASGGVGKTTISIGLCACLSQNYKKVLYINASSLQLFGHMLSVNTPICSPSVYARLSTCGDDAYECINSQIKNEGFDYLPPFRSSLTCVGLNYSIYEKILNSLKKEKIYDYIVVDTDSSFDEGKSQLFDMADKVIMVTSPQKASLYSTNLLLSNLNDVNEEKYTFLCNSTSKNNDANNLASEKIEFSIHGYIGFIENCENFSAKELGKEKDIQKAMFLII